MSSRMVEVRGESLETMPSCGLKLASGPNADPKTRLKMKASTSGARKAMIRTDRSLILNRRSLAAIVRILLTRLSGPSRSGEGKPPRGWAPRSRPRSR